ncbi:MAG: hypothetical protein J6O61_06725 [Butyrivibrio sp.]|uniref:hypothetical protein n=1 Tax=Butyrivibrio sp. TaxID=28121 RepID=UPI001B07A956|nr:hypothetical protein [Butyrivibrio sp.]MBO6240523.1 hypothetical protein [Butyrivibrio sp.]
MNRISLSDRLIIKGFNQARKIHTTLWGTFHPQKPQASDNPAFSNKRIHDLLCSERPCMIGRFGSNEIECTVFARNRMYYKYDLLNYARGKSDIWWYPDNLIERMYNNAGFFLPIDKQFDLFGKEMIAAMPLVDVLGSWCKEESYFSKELSNATFVDLELLNPLWGSDTEPWTTALEGKKVLVVHPFTETIQSQYAKRNLVHKDSRILPEFTLQTLKAVQSITGVKPNGFETWFDALHYMENEIDKHDYEICIIGCGAYGFLLAAHCKRQGKKAIHLGGATQLLFGIKGKRWENPNYGFNGTSYSRFFTPYWVRPLPEETPDQAQNIEEGCYW